MKDFVRFDEVTVFDGKLIFLIPHEWEEIAEEDHYLYSFPGTDSGWFRVSLNTSRPVDKTPAESLARIFDGKPNVNRDNETGNVVHSFERETEEQGVKIRLYYWFVANVVEPAKVREAVFSYTILAARAANAHNQKAVGVLGNLVSRAKFPPDI